MTELVHPGLPKNVKKKLMSKETVGPSMGGFTPAVKISLHGKNYPTQQ